MGRQMFDPTGLFRTWVGWRHRLKGQRAPAIRQRQLLLALLRRAARTRFGIDHDFAAIRDVTDYQSQVPLRSYSAHWSEYWEQEFPLLQDCTWPGLIPFFAKTSGTTTGTSKYIPYTREMSRGATQGMFSLFAYHVLSRRQSRLFGGSAVVLSGPEELEKLAPGVSAGAVSAITARISRRWLRRRLLPPPEIAAIEDWETKISRLAPLSLDHPIRGLGGSPNWLLIFLDEVARCYPEDPCKLAAWYPELELIVHGGVNFAPYRQRFLDLLESSHAETREVYSASEGFFAVADRGDGEGLALVLDAGVFFEFIPVAEINATEPTRHWIANVEPDIDYAVVVTTAAGLWAYRLEDTVRFLSREPPRLLVTGRTNYVLSLFGEHLIEEEIAEAVSAAGASVGANVLEYAVAAELSRGEQPGGRQSFLIECLPRPEKPEARERFANTLDARLQALNDDYRELRAGDYSLDPPQVRFAPPNGFLSWMKARRALGGQNKVPRIIQDSDLFADLLTFMDAAEKDNPQ